MKGVMVGPAVEFAPLTICAEICINRATVASAGSSRKNLYDSIRNAVSKAENNPAYMKIRKLILESILYDHEKRTID